MTCIRELPAARDGEAGELGQVLGDVAHRDVSDLGVAEAELPQHLQPRLLVQQPRPRVPGGREQLVEAGVCQVRHVAQVQILEKRKVRAWRSEIDQNKFSFTLVSSSIQFLRQGDQSIELVTLSNS